jgi:hypothetical protein
MTDDITYGDQIDPELVAYIEASGPRNASASYAG